MSQNVRGHFAYYGITGNSVALSRQRRDGTVTWSKFTGLLERYVLPPPVAIHSVLRRVASS